MAFDYFVVLEDTFDAKLELNGMEFWCMMHIAMLCGSATTHQVNWWLILAGLKEHT